MNEKNELVLFKSKDGQVSLPVTLERETVWLSQRQMAELFGKDRTVIGRHIRNAIDEGEVDAKTMCAKFAHMGRDADQVYKVDVYNLDVVISVGYRVKSKRGVEFRRWATSVLRDYLLKGAAVNEMRLRQLGQAIEVMKRVSNRLNAHRADGHDRRVASRREGNDGQPRHDLPGLNTIPSSYRPIPKTASPRGRGNMV